MENPYAFPFYWNPPFNAIIGVFWLALNMEILLIDWSQLLKYSVNVPSLSHIKRVCKKFTEKKEIFSGTKNPDCDKINKWCVCWPADLTWVCCRCSRFSTTLAVVSSKFSSSVSLEAGRSSVASRERGSQGTLLSPRKTSTEQNTQTLNDNCY